ncbi:photosystem II stability/assembly factor-like uncharacterized protein [Solirubrobacter pauli]|uniref:Photosystem II stability/assembly factor-like uncharacterized protein n=1 Tax=Solirubrobacter pauli TaxID=166793 RepID=A0A660LFR7_9ACTN|nr:sialidase family protein [Solirubrobacter pauli]RKQ93977.1 photosystem II stability/assembly factor-like uncharacterized protein [Solirubrobacter pauli]
MSDFLDRYGEELKRARRRQRWHRVRGFGGMPTRQRSRHRTAVVAFGLAAVLAAVLTVAFTHSTTRVSSKAPVDVASAVPPENEALEHRNGFTPNEFKDFQLSSNDTVSRAQVDRMKAQAAAVAPAAGAAGLPWKQLGPYNIGGRVTDVVADRFTPNSAIAAVSGGGIWRTTDGGEHWASIWPDDWTQTMGAVAQGADGALWAGTGEANPPGGGLTYFGDGLYKSTDKGGHWTRVGLEKSESIGRIAVDPSNPDVVFAAAAGHVARSAAQRGLYRTTDGGKTWDLVLAPPNSTTGAVDVAINPKNPRIVYGVLWDHKRTNGTRTYGGIGSGLFRSDDGGTTWKRLETMAPGQALPTYDQTQTGLKADASLGRIGVAVAPSNPNRVYVVFGSPYGPDKGFYYSNDGGDSWCTTGGTTECPFTAGRAYQANGGYQWWFGRVWVDPDDQNHLFNADVSLRTSTNGGATWTAINAPHSDQHGMDWDPASLDGDPATPNKVFLGNDGGVYRSDASGVNGTWVKANNQPWNQAYHLSVSKQRPRRLVQGLQDNGSVKTWTPQAQVPTDPELRDWTSAGGGDGHQNAIDPTDDNIYYTCSQSSGGGTHSCGRRTDSATGTTTANVAQVGPAGSNRYTTDAPIVTDPNVPPAGADGTQPPNALYVAGAIVGRSLNRGTSFSEISPRPLPQANYTDPDPSLPGHVPASEVDIGLYTNLYGAVTALAPAKSKTPVPYAQVIYAGTDTGKVWKTSDAGANWVQMQGLPTRWVNSVIADPDDADHAYVAFSGFREGDDAANVWETTDGGATWLNISSNLPNGPIEMLEYDPKGNVLFAATDVGVFDHKDGDTSWYTVSVGLPQVPVLDVKLSQDGKSLYAATFGRSVWELPLSVDATDGGGVGGSVPATLSLTLGAPGSFGAFQPGVPRDYATSTTATVISTAGDAALSVQDPSSTAPGHLVNGAFSLPQALQAGVGGTFAPLSAAALVVKTWTAPTANEPVKVDFKQSIGANDALRTGSYSKTLTFTLSTTNP